MLSAWIAVFDGRARLDRPGLVQYRTLTEYSASHRPATRATRASRTKDAAAAPAPRPTRPSTVRRLRATRSSKYVNEYFIYNLKVWSHALESNGMLRAYFTRELSRTYARRGGRRRNGARCGERRARSCRAVFPPARRRTLRRPFIVLGSGSWTSRQCCQRENFTRRMGKMFLLILEIWKL